MLFPKPQHKRRPKEKVQKIILQEQKECYITKYTTNLHKHHIFYGPLRKWSELYGLTVWLRSDWHTGSQGVHFNPTLDLHLKQLAQMAFERIYSRELFVKIFRRSYL